MGDSSPPPPSGLPLGETQAKGAVHRVAIGSRWRKLNRGQQALLALVYLRKGDVRPVGGRVRVGTTTAWRYLEETVGMPSGFAASGGDVSVTPPPGNATSLPIASLAGNRRAWPAASARITTRVPITSRSHAV